jgi:hypothetical protein
VKSISRLIPSPAATTNQEKQVQKLIVGLQQVIEAPSAISHL